MKQSKRLAKGGDLRMAVTEDIAPEPQPVDYLVDWNPRLAPLWETTIAAFLQPRGGVAPLGLTVAEAEAAVALGQKLLPLVTKGEAFLLTLDELVIFLSLLELLHRDLASEFHQELQGLQETMVDIVTAQTSKQMQRALEPLTKEAEKATQRLRSVLKQRGQLLDEVARIRAAVVGYLGVSEK